MSKKKRRGGRTPAPKGASSAGPADSSRYGRHLDHLLLALCAAGVLLTAYLTYVAWFGDYPRYCRADSACDLVQSSRWSTLLGLPMAFWGLLTYAILSRLVWQRRTKPATWRAALFVAVCAVAVSTYLTVISVVEIEATCAYCLASYAIASTILVIVLLRRPGDRHQFPWGKSLGAPLITAAVIVAGLQMHYSGLFDAAAGPENPDIKALAVHLAATDAKFYGAYWCQRCQEQKALFEASADRLPYVECTPNGRNGPQSGTCTVHDIRDYPTWIIKGKRHSGIVGLRQLALYSGFPIPESGLGN